MQKLFSSVPKREYALHNINLSFGTNATTSQSQHNDGVILLVGRSASGKSTLLRLLAGMELPIDGYVSINGHMLYCNQAQVTSEMPCLPPWVKMGMPLPPAVGGEEYCGSRVQPVILQSKPDFDNTLSVMERMVRVGLDIMQQCNKEWKCADEEHSEEETIALLQTLAHDFASLLTLSKMQCISPPSDLSPSGQYLFGIGCSCMMSVAPSIANQNTESISRNGIHYPILLFDELFDTEHPSTVEKCSKGILNLISAGAVVISATHRPAYFECMSSRTVTLSGGKVLTDKYVSSSLHR